MSATLDRVSLVSKDSLTIGKITLAKREAYILSGLIVIICAILVLSIILGIRNKQGESVIKALDYNNICYNADCLWQAAYIVNNMNISADPCTDFYEFACGLYPSQFPVDPLADNTYHIQKHLTKTNYDKLRSLLETIPKGHGALNTSAEGKMRVFFQTCMNDSEKQQAGNQPLLNVINDLGGWWVFGNWSSEDFDKDELFRKIKVEYWEKAFVSITPVPDENKTLVHLKIQSEGFGMYYIDYSRITFDSVMSEYRQLIRDVTELLVRDVRELLSVTEKEQRMAIFLNDVLNVETQLYRIKTRIGTQYKGSETLFDIDLQTKAFNWTALVQDTFGDDVDIDWDIMTVDGNYLQAVSELALSLSNRTLHNYLLWRIIGPYSLHLTVEYAHVHHRFAKQVKGDDEIFDNWNFCVHHIYEYFGDALDSLFVQDHFVDAGLKKIEDLAKDLRNIILKYPEMISWMDRETQELAKEKIINLQLFIGYPKWIADIKELDEYYSAMKIDPNDFFANRLNMNKLRKTQLRDSLKKDFNKQKWVAQVFLPYIYYSFITNKVYLPAGVLQHPLFDPNLPSYMNYGSGGYLIAIGILKSIFGNGRYYDVDKKMGDWWCRKSDTEYRKRKECVSKWLNSVNSTVTYNNTKYTYNSDIKVNPEADMEAIFAIKETYKAYKIWETQNGPEKLLPGLPVNSSDQAFFLSFAQVSCYSLTEQKSQDIYNKKLPTTQTRLLSIASHVKEFAEAFECPLSSIPRTKETCDIF